MDRYNDGKDHLSLAPFNIMGVVLVRCEIDRVESVRKAKKEANPTDTIENSKGIDYRSAVFF